MTTASVLGVFAHVDTTLQAIRDLRANAVYEGSYLMGTSIARPLIAKAQVEVARAEAADAESIVEVKEVLPHPLKHGSHH